MSTRFSLGVERARADAGRDGRTRLARPNSQARTGTGKICLPFSSDQEEQDWQPYPVDAQSAERDDDTLNTKHYCLHIISFYALYE